MLSLLTLVGGLGSVWGLDTQSRYSDLSDKTCKVTFHESEGDRTQQECPGVLGYSLLKDTDDDRDSLTVVHGKKTQPLAFFGHVTGSLNYLGEKVEWRVRDGQPIALVVRMYFTDPETSQKQQRLIVARVQPEESCVTQIINASKIPNANELAAEAADRAVNEKCLWKIDPRSLTGSFQFDQFHTAEAKCRQVHATMVQTLIKTYFCETDLSSAPVPILASCTSADGQKKLLFFKQVDVCQSVLDAQR